MTKKTISLDCKTVSFFLKISKEIGKAWRKSLTRAKRASLTRLLGVWGERKNPPVSLSVFSLAPDLLFDCSSWLEYAKVRTVLQSTNRPFPSSPSLCFKTRSSAQPLIWRWFFILVQIKLIFTRKGVHLTSFWMWGFLELGSGLLKRLLCWKRTRKRVSELGKRKKPPLLLHFLIIE